MALFERQIRGLFVCGHPLGKEFVSCCNLFDSTFRNTKVTTLKHHRAGGEGAEALQVRILHDGVTKGLKLNVADFTDAIRTVSLSVASPRGSLTGQS